MVKDIIGYRDYSEINQAIDDHAVEIEELKKMVNSVGVLYFLIYGLIQGKINNDEAETLLNRLINFSDDDIGKLKRVIKDVESSKQRNVLSEMVKNLESNRREEKSN